ncbi:MAG: lipopolysaccharide heptosyltransferase II [Candidatus Omnitrophica bacterium]|nr:lipopolysaccharide heptosyltransferase II [Candidatus Omnitrophota bacterium]
MRPVSLQRILIVNIFGIGDVLFTTPLVGILKAAYPDARIGYLCNRRTAPLLERNPKIDKIFVYERDELEAVRRKSVLRYLKAVGELVQDMKAGRFDASLDVSLNTFMGFLTRAAGIPRRVGFDYKGRGRFLTRKVPLQGYEDKHVVEYYLDLLAEFGVPVPDRHRAMDLLLTKEDTDWAGKFLQENQTSGRGLVIGLVPGGGESWGRDALYKRWPAACFAKLADKLVENHAAQIILMGSPSESELCREAAGAMRHPCLSACGKTSLTQFAALTRRCTLVVTNDGGPLHVAVAAGSRTASIFGPVDEAVYGPYPADGHKVIKKKLACQPCYRRFRRADCGHIRCLADLSVEEVFKEVEAIL